MQRVLQVREPWFSFIRSGRKTIEGRRGRFEDFQRLESVSFQCDAESLQASVLRVRHYPTLAEMVRAEDLARLLPGVADEQGALDVYHGFWNDAFIAASGGMVAMDLALHDPNKRQRAS